MPRPTRANDRNDPAKDRRPEADPSAPPSRSSLPSPPVSTRRVARQATSALAFTPSPEPEEDDPLLAFAPFVHPQPRRNSITPDLQRRFVSTLAATGIVSQAARSIGKSMEALYKLRHRPGAEGFAAAWDEALDRGVARLEDGALARAIAGEERLVVSAGKVLGTETRHNESLVMFFLRNRRVERYAPDWRNIRPGHPVYEAIREDLEADFAKRLAERDAEQAQIEEARERALRERQREYELAEIEREEEEDRLAREEEENLPPDERQRRALLYGMRHWTLEELLRKVAW